MNKLKLCHIILGDYNYLDEHKCALTIVKETKTIDSESLLKSFTSLT